MLGGKQRKKSVPNRRKLTRRPSLFAFPRAFPDDRRAALFRPAENIKKPAKKRQYEEEIRVSADSETAIIIFF
jgi:hypothetical protein